MKKIILTLAAILVSALGTMAQSNFSLDFTTVGFDFGDRENAAIYKLKASESGKTVAEPGIRLAGEVYSSDVVSLKFAQTLRIDEMKKLAMSTQLMLRLRLIKIYKHSINIGFGPQIFYRNTWEKEEGYIDEGVYNKGSFQTKMSWVSGEVEYNYYLNKHNDFSLCIYHMNPETMGFALGFKHWISRKSNKCNTCPSFH
ncbi:MAG: hypothetical protein MJZ66_07815 [Bacteroidales bacterium]|nr:hypothetical protein [Bacteroidales bacterium]